MQIKLNRSIFEWWLAGWAGYTENPAELFPSLQNTSWNELANKLEIDMRAAGLSEEIIKRFRQNRRSISSTVSA